MQNEITLKRRNRVKFFKNILYFFISFFAVIIICYFLFKTNGFYPFDSKNGLTMISIDCQSQYITYLNNLKIILDENKSIVYTLSKTFGGDYFSIYSYYLASPFTLIVVLFPRDLIPLALLCVNVLKMAFASLNMALLFKYKSKKLSLASLALSISYGLCSYCFVYLSNFMWLDGVMILPLVILGLDIVIESDKIKLYWMYSLSLAYALYSSWYIGAMIVVFVCIYFLYLLIYKKDTFKSRKNKILKFLLFSLLGGMISSLLWIPAFTNFSGTKVKSNMSNFFFYYPSLFFKGFFSSSYDGMNFIASYEGKATMFTSVPTLVLAIFYFSNRGISRRERFTYLGIVIIYFLAVSITVVNDIFHFGSKPTWFPARYSFIISFITVLAAERQISEFNKQDVFSILIGALLTIGLICVLIFVPISKYDSSKFTMTNFDFIIFLLTIIIITLTFILLIKSLNKTRTLTVINSTLSLSLAALIISSNYIGENNIISSNVNDSLYQEYSTYLNDLTLISVTDKVKEYDNSIYRMEMSENRDGAYNNVDNNPMFYSYNGLSHFSSSEKKEVEEYLRKIGYQYNGYFESFARGSTTAMNSFLGVKYVIESKYKKINSLHYDSAYTCFDSTNEYLSDEFESNSADFEYRYYKNNFALPLGYRVEKQYSTFINEGVIKNDENIYWFDDFEYQNEIYHNLNGSVKQDVFKAVDYTITTNGLTVVSKNELTGETYYTGNTGATMTISFSTSDNVNDGLYFGLKNNIENISVTYDRSYLGRNDYWTSGLFSLANSSFDHTIALTFRNKLENVLIRPELYLEQYDVLNEYISKIKEQATLDLKEVNTLTTYSLEGTFNLIDDNSDFIFTLPYEKKMKVYVDGKKLQTSKKFNVFTGVSLDGIKKGNHTIKITFDEYGLKFGIVISTIGLISLIAIEVIFEIHRKKRVKLLLSNLL